MEGLEFTDSALFLFLLIWILILLGVGGKEFLFLLEIPFFSLRGNVSEFCWGGGVL